MCFLHPEFDDFGDVLLVSDNGATGYFRVDWFAPEGFCTWDDRRTFILGTDGSIERRKYVDVDESKDTNNIYWVDAEGEYFLNVTGKVRFPYFGQRILGCIHRTECAMTQKHVLKAAELCVKAQKLAKDLSERTRGGATQRKESGRP